MSAATATTNPTSTKATSAVMTPAATTSADPVQPRRSPSRSIAAAGLAVALLLAGLAVGRVTANASSVPIEGQPSAVSNAETGPIGSNDCAFWC